MLIGYARTSTQDQVAGFEDQLAELTKAGCEHIYKEQVSSVVERDQLNAMLSFIRKGDVVVVTKLDRLCRNVVQLLETVTLIEAKGASLRILGMQLDTGTATGRMVLTMLGAVAELERGQMLERTRIGLAKAKAEGRCRGRPPHQMAKATTVRTLLAGGMGPVEVAEQTGMSRASVWRISKGMDAGFDTSMCRVKA